MKLEYNLLQASYSTINGNLRNDEKVEGQGEGEGEGDGEGEEEGEEEANELRVRRYKARAKAMEELAEVYRTR